MTPLIQGSDGANGRHFIGPFVRIVYFELEPSCGGKNPKHVHAATRRSRAGKSGSTACAGGASADSTSPGG